MIGAIEEAMLARLTAAGDAGVLGYRFKQRESLPVDVDERLIERIKAYPACGTVFAGWRALSSAGSSTKVRAMVHLVLAAQNARNEKATRISPTPGEPGAYQLVMDAVALLQGQRLGLPIGPLMLGDCASLYSGAKGQGQSISLFAVTFTTDFAIDALPPLDQVGDFKLFHADWDIPPFGGVDADPVAPGVQLPDDAHADTVSEVILPQENTP